MSSVTAVTGGEIGHICNQVSFENLTKIENVVLSAGQNCINDVDEMEKGNWESRTMEEVRKLENTITKLTGEGKKVFLFPVPPVPVATSSKERKDARAFLNGKLLSIVNVIQSKNKLVQVTSPFFKKMMAISTRPQTTRMRSTFHLWRWRKESASSMNSCQTITN